MKKDIIKILRDGGVGVLPTDTIYGIVGSAFSAKAVERIFDAKERPKDMPIIVLISNIKDLEKFGVDYDPKVLKTFWPGKVSVILQHASVIVSKKFKYIHRGKNAIAFRLPKKKSLIALLKKTGPLVAPSANLSGMTPARNITEAKNYFGNKVDFYLAGGTIPLNKPSTLLRIGTKGEIEVLRGTLKAYGKRK